MSYLLVPCPSQRGLRTRRGTTTKKVRAAITPTHACTCCQRLSDLKSLLHSTWARSGYDLRFLATVKTHTNCMNGMTTARPHRQVTIFLKITVRCTITPSQSKTRCEKTRCAPRNSDKTPEDEQQARPTICAIHHESAALRHAVPRGARQCGQGHPRRPGTRASLPWQPAVPNRDA